jgi:poly(3-hydroxybutyrate) depolymerase
MREGGVRYDEILLAMVEEVAQHYGLRFDRFALFGYSGGGHFTHRFLMLQPNRLWAASIGAPGSVTLLDPTRDWWVGTRNMAELFGAVPDIEAMRKVAVQMIVGAADLETWEITHQPGNASWMPDANHAGVNRPERLDTLRRNFEEHGISVRFDLVPNMPHDGLKAVSRVEDFFADVLAKRRSGAAKAA